MSATQFPDDEIMKLIETKFATCAGYAGEEFNMTARKFEPEKSERTLIEDFASKPFEELEDCFGIYKETLP